MYSNMSLNVPCQKSSNVPFLGFFSFAESGYKSAVYPNWKDPADDVRALCREGVS